MATKKTAEKKTATKRTRKTKATDEVTFRGNKYILLEEANGKCKLTDGMIHFWVRGDEVVKAD